MGFLAVGVLVLVVFCNNQIIAEIKDRSAFLYPSINDLIFFYRMSLFDPGWSVTRPWNRRNLGPRFRRLEGLQDQSSVNQGGRMGRVQGDRASSQWSPPESLSWNRMEQPEESQMKMVIKKKMRSRLKALMVQHRSIRPMTREHSKWKTTYTKWNMMPWTSPSQTLQTKRPQIKIPRLMTMQSPMMKRG